MSSPSNPLHDAIERVLTSVSGELTFQALHVRVQEARDVLMPESHLATALGVLVAGDVVQESKVGQRITYRWLGWKRAPVPAVAPPEPAPAAQPTQEIIVPKPLTSTPRGQTRERVRTVWLTDKTLSAAAISAKLGDVSEDAVSYHLAILRREDKANGSDTAATFVRAKREGKKAACPPPKPKRGNGEQPLDAELQRISARFAPIVHLTEKIAVLDQLASGINGKVGALLIEIREDLVRVAA